MPSPGSERRPEGTKKIYVPAKATKTERKPKRAPTCSRWGVGETGKHPGTAAKERERGGPGTVKRIIGGTNACGLGVRMREKPRDTGLTDADILTLRGGLMTEREKSLPLQKSVDEKDRDRDRCRGAIGGFRAAKSLPLVDISTITKRE